MRWKKLLLAMLLLTPLVAFAQADKPKADTAVSAHGSADGAVPAWSITTRAPDGWTADCCMYAKAIGVDFVLYQGEWSGKPDRVMVLNVWPRKLPTLDAEWQGDQANYLKKDPKATVAAFAIDNRKMKCHGLLYQGSDHIDDAVVFCDPGKAAGVRFSWSMSVAADDAQRSQVAALFRQVVETSRYAIYLPSGKTTGKAVAH